MQLKNLLCALLFTDDAKDVECFRHPDDGKQVESHFSRQTQPGEGSLLLLLTCIKQPSVNDVLARIGEQRGLLERIHAFTRFPAMKIHPRSCEYEVMMDLCTVTEHVIVEALYLQGGWEGEGPKEGNMPIGCGAEEFQTREWSGSMYSTTLTNAIFAIRPWLPRVAHMTNPDGTYLTEGQLRPMFREFMSYNYCSHESMTSHKKCDNYCCILPGDTVYWKVDGPFRVLTRWEPATDDELRERGWLDQGGMLHNLCRWYRENPDGDGDDDE